MKSLVSIIVYAWHVGDTQHLIFQIFEMFLNSEYQNYKLLESVIYVTKLLKVLANQKIYFKIVNYFSIIFLPFNFLLVIIH